MESSLLILNCFNVLTINQKSLKTMFLICMYITKFICIAFSDYEMTPCNACNGDMLYVVKKALPCSLGVLSNYYFKIDIVRLTGVLHAFCVASMTSKYLSI